MRAAMTMTQVSGSDAQSAVPRIIMSVCLALCVMNAFSLVVSALSGQWILDSGGLGIPTDFANVYAAGKLVLEGHAATAYDWDAHKRVEEIVLGQTFDGYFGWHYPPPFLFIAALLAKMPYTAAFAGWMALSFVPYLLTIRALTNHRVGWTIACAFPVALVNAMIGQNGFLTASLIGGTLYLMPKRPLLAGVCLGLLTYKPQYGLLFPLVLIAAGYWRTFVSAAVTAVLVAAISWLAFGTETWIAFFHWLPRASQAFLSDGFAEFGKMQSALSLTRFLGGSEKLAWTLQWSVTGVVAVALVALWRSRVQFEIKAAALATGTLLATPYLYLYDMVVLAIPMALMIRMGLANGFLNHELAAVGVATALLVSFQFVVAPVGLMATLIVAGLIARRAVLSWNQNNDALVQTTLRV
jgi:arabinofuranan 3-O-arabinosyltransferase